ncbi:hypothetical protein JCGZ_11008 [Jatropha curcas]|uniref:Uncharacterized protein n=1 Tax=Jatropha curcas TaxID=180498 RepID=A0A067KQV6_JATCU|nr:hypothetical protein JCGZ_11008 [Jatropha curcas]
MARSLNHEDDRMEYEDDNCIPGVGSESDFEDEASFIRRRLQGTVNSSNQGESSAAHSRSGFSILQLHDETMPKQSPEPRRTRAAIAHPRQVLLLTPAKRTLLLAPAKKMISPSEMRANASLDQKTLIAYAEDCRAGVCFHLQRILSEFCNEWGVTIGQIAPNSNQMILGAAIVAEQEGFELNVHQLHNMEVEREVLPYQLSSRVWIPFSLRSTPPALRRPRIFSDVESWQIKILRRYACNPPPLFPLLDANIPLGPRARASRKRGARETGVPNDRAHSFVGELEDMIRAIMDVQLDSSLKLSSRVELLVKQKEEDAAVIHQLQVDFARAEDAATEATRSVNDMLILQSDLILAELKLQFPEEDWFSLTRSMYISIWMMKRKWLQRWMPKGRLRKVQLKGTRGAERV